MGAVGLGAWCLTDDSLVDENLSIHRYLVEILVTIHVGGGQEVAPENIITLQRYKTITKNNFH